MAKIVYSREIILNHSIDELRLLLVKKIKNENRKHTISPTGAIGRISGKKILFYYRHKKLEDEDISLIPGNLPDLTVHHKYAKSILTPVDGTSTKITTDFIDDSLLFIRLSWLIFFPLFVLLSAFISFSIAGNEISYTAAGIIFVFFSVLWLFITVCFTKNVKSESDDTFPLLENEIICIFDTL